MKSSVMRPKTAKARQLSAKESMDIMWRDCQWCNSKGVSPMFRDHVPNYTKSISTERTVKVRPVAVASRG